ncbi:mitochondrial K+-H+ exchange-related-domain-containing protein [Mycena belliarum]|uniref:Mitochondrial K+-H+ exchange-related-domain-containing protein n=1 Tax=Mycena belliarum TaxID=1033014 RepID=A0AAD6UGY3_9AGAR|nr:mitochondrial K+-H+ exchange-related-domain-containing protein [Mycena belliae]
MAMIPSSGPMRIVALPLVRPSRAGSSKLPVFYSFKFARLKAPPPTRSTAFLRRTFLARWLPEEGVVSWSLRTANRTWANFGTAEKGSLKLRAFQLGERLMDRLDFEESNLKTIDQDVAQIVQDAGLQVPLWYPPAALSGPQSLDNLRALVEERIPLHNRGMAMWIFLAVLSAPLKLIPIIPNFPFYFCAWRTFSHAKARRGAGYIQSMLQNNRIVPQPLLALNAVYAAKRASDDVLTRDALERAVRALNMAPEEAKELIRAQEQVVARLAKAKTS